MLLSKASTSGLSPTVWTEVTRREARSNTMSRALPSQAMKARRRGASISRLWSGWQPRGLVVVGGGGVDPSQRGDGQDTVDPGHVRDRGEDAIRARVEHADHTGPEMGDEE